MANKFDFIMTFGRNDQSDRLVARRLSKSNNNHFENSGGMSSTTKNHISNSGLET